MIEDVPSDLRDQMVISETLLAASADANIAPGRMAKRPLPKLGLM